MLVTLLTKVTGQVLRTPVSFIIGGPSFLTRIVPRLSLSQQATTRPNLFAFLFSFLTPSLLAWNGHLRNESIYPEIPRTRVRTRTRVPYGECRMCVYVDGVCGFPTLSFFRDCLSLSPQPSSTSTTWLRTTKKRGQNVQTDGRSRNRDGAPSPL